MQFHRARQHAPSLWLPGLLLTLAILPNPASAKTIGIYVFENLEGRNVTSSTAATILARELRDAGEQVSVASRVPLQSNETIRLLDEMSTGETLVSTRTATAFAGGGVIQFETTKISDEVLKYTDLTWHIDQAALMDLAKEAGVDYVLMGDVRGTLLPPSSVGGGKLRSVEVSGRLQLVNVKTGMADWSDILRSRQADFQEDLAFDKAAETGALAAAKSLLKTITPPEPKEDQ